MRHKILSVAMALTMALSLFSFASAAEVQRHEVPVTLTVIQTEQRISVTVPAAMPVSVVDGYVVTATNAAIRNTADNGAIKVTAVEVNPGACSIGNYDNFSGTENTIALSLNGCGTTGAGALAITEKAFPVIDAGKELPIHYNAKVATAGELKGVNAATVVFTIAAAE